MRYLLGFLCVCALGVVPVIGCGETTPNLCEGVECEDDDNECREDGVCNPKDGMCEYAPAEDGKACGNHAGTCQHGSCRVACDEQGILDAIAAGGGPYTFDCDGAKTVVTVAEIIIDNDVILDGEGNLTVDGDSSHRLFSVLEDVTAELRGFAVTNGGVPREPPDIGASGGGIWNAGTLTLTHSTVSRNGIRLSGTGSGIYNRGTMILTHTTVSRNVADEGFGDPAGIANVNGLLMLTSSIVSENTGYGIRASGPQAEVTLIESRVSGNTSGGMFLYGGLCLLNRSTVSGNNSPSGGGGIRLGGGLLRLIDSTVSGNHTERSGGGIYHTAEPQSADLTVVNSTISGNTAGDAGGGIYSVYEGWIRIVSSTISNNTAGGVGDAFFFERQWLPSTISSSLVDGDCSGDIGDFVSDGYNIESPGDTCGFDQTGDQSGVTAEQLNLGPLQDNGGPTETHALLPGSFAIDQVPLADCVDADGQPLTTDQRGEPRPETGGAMCDVGAFEVQP